jgi:hypothetical protein
MDIARPFLFGGLMELFDVVAFGRTAATVVAGLLAGLG